jgi:hypothetical protein
MSALCQKQTNGSAAKFCPKAGVIAEFHLRCKQLSIRSAVTHR